MKIAAVQMDIKIFEKEQNLARVIAGMEEASRAGAKVIAFPECALTGYCFETREEAWSLAETVPGPASEKLAAAAKHLDCTAIVGMIEREGDTLYNAAVVVDPTGILGSYRKMHLPCLGLDKLSVVGEKPFPVFATKHGRIGVNICYDCSIPEAARVLKLQGAQLLVIPTNWPWGSDSWEHTPKVRATENHMHVVACDRVGEERGIRFCGHSQIVDFMCKVHAEAGDTEETIIYADLDLAAADNNRVVRVPGVWEFDRIAARRPEMYRVITESRATNPTLDVEFSVPAQPVFIYANFISSFRLSRTVEVCDILGALFISNLETLGKNWDDPNGFENFVTREPGICEAIQVERTAAGGLHQRFVDQSSHGGWNEFSIPPDVQKLLSVAREVALAQNRRIVTPEDILLAFTKLDAISLSRRLVASGLNVKRLEEVVAAANPPKPIPPAR